MLNAAAVVAETKGSVSTVSKPAFAPTYENMETTVTITSTTGATIYYTLDGTEPTTASEVYTDPLTFKEAKTIKAFAVRDGFYDSEVSEYTVELKKKAAAPEFSLAYADSSTTVTMSSDIEGAQIYYTFKKGVTDYKACAPYTEPIVLTVEPGTVYAFVRETDDYVGSEVDSVHVAIKHITKDNIRLDVVSEYNCDEASWKTNPRVEGDASDSKTYYPWGKKAWDYYDTDNILSQEPVLDEEGNPVLNEDGTPKINYTYADKADRLKYAYATNEAATEYAKQWRLYSEGQVLVHEFTNNPSYEFSDPNAEQKKTGRYFDRAEDMIGNMATKGHLSFKGKPSGAPYCAGIESVVPFDAPFDVVVLAGNAAGKEGNQLDLSLSTDGENWTKVHDIKLSDIQQVIRKDRYSVNEPGKWYVRVGQTKGSNDIHMYNLYILNNGKLSQAYDGQTGIEEIIAGNEAAEVVAVEVYNLNGYRLAKAEQGVNIIRTVYADGTVKVEKVIVK
ncbi:MAG: chitobiase/beta-hexosaminidase C-terminal domain-containing protein [Duncaniella sp.]|nr:chitobiase/beta-hexosaminidase C-terminal domain-containing protein [Duncaniella sp.]